jgi:hypothetical protein
MAATAFAAPALADNDPSMSQIYAAADGGHLDQAQQMIDQVLRDHPRSAKAHYVAAQLYAREGKLPLARGQLNVAEELAPGLPFAQAQAVQSLKAELAGAPRLLRPVAVAPAGYSFPWGAMLLLVAVLGVLWMLFRRRGAAAGYPAPGAVAGAPPGPYAGPAGYGSPVGGMGSGIAGGLASGLAVGAGVVAGEELARHFLDGHHEGTVVPPANVPEAAPPNSDMGGADFGVTQDPDSWDDSSGGDGGGGGGDWGDSGGGDWT